MYLQTYGALKYVQSVATLLDNLLTKYTMQTHQIKSKWLERSLAGLIVIHSDVSSINHGNMKKNYFCFWGLCLCYRTESWIMLEGKAQALSSLVCNGDISLQNSDKLLLKYPQI